MSVLSDTQIIEALNSGRLKIDPRPTPESGKDSPYDPCSVQLHIDDTIQVPKAGMKLAFDLSQPGLLRTTLDSIWEKKTIPETGYILDPGHFILAQTREIVGFPKVDDKVLAGRIEGRSSFARTGLLIHFTAPTIHAEYDGTITLELLNHGPMPLTLRRGLAICQLIVETVRGVPSSKAGQFQDQRTPSGAPA